MVDIILSRLAYVKGGSSCQGHSHALKGYLWVGLGQFFRGSIIAFMPIDPTSMGQFRYETSSLGNELLRLLLH